MESGAYGAAKAGGSFDLRRFLTQPQVVTRAVCLVSRWGAGRGNRTRPPGPGQGRGCREPASATGGGGRGRGCGVRGPRVGRAREPGPRRPPSSGPCRPQLAGRSFPRLPLVPTAPHRPGRRGGARRRRGGAGLSPCWRWEELGAAPGQVASVLGLPAGGIHPEGAFPSTLGNEVSPPLGEQVTSLLPHPRSGDPRMYPSQ